MTDVTIPTIEPEDMPSFLNEIACTYFQDDPEIRHKLALCSVYIHGVNWHLRNQSKEET